MDSGHVDPFSSLQAALTAGYRDPCLHCLPNLNFTAMTQQQVQTTPALPITRDEGNNEEIRDGFFHAHIHNNERGGNEPTFSFLSLQPGFGKDIAQVVSYIETHQVRHIFLLFAGQQYPDFGRHFDEGDRWFCRALTGGDKLNAGGQYRIHASDKYNSVAYELFKHYVDGDRNQAVIIDVLNTKYNWSKLESNKAEVEAYMFDLIFNKLYQALQPATRQQLNFFISGFSRGAVFSLLLARRLKRADPHLNIAAVVTVDPVINHDSHADMALVRRDNGWGLLKRRVLYKRRGNVTTIGGHDYMQSRPIGMLMKNYFPVLEGAEDTPHYNVFQRRSLPKAACKKPIGSAVDGATSPVDTPEGCVAGPIDPAESASPFNQYDLSISRHTPDMLDKYWQWIRYLAFDILPSVALTTEPDVLPDPAPDPAPEAEQFVSRLSFEIQNAEQVISNSPAPVDRGVVLSLIVNVNKEFASGSTEPYAGQTVRFAVDEFGLRERNLGTAVTNAEGVAEISYTVPDNITEGETWFSVYYPQSSSEEAGQRFIMIPPLISDVKAKPMEFAQTTDIHFYLHGRTNVEIAIYTQLGGFGSAAHRRTLIRNQWLDAGPHSVKWNGTNEGGRPVWRGYYKCRILLAGGEERVINRLHKTKGKW
ncbi:hypothetical protein ACFL2V_08830 [Pseudomonadota bacterium]